MYIGLGGLLILILILWLLGVIWSGAPVLSGNPAFRIAE